MGDTGSQRSETSSHVNDIQQYEGFSDAAMDVKQIARTASNDGSSNRKDSVYLLKMISHMSQIDGVDPFHQQDSKLDPFSDKFDAKVWIKNLRKRYDSDIEYYHPLSLSMACKNLKARGLAADADYKPTVLNGCWKYAKDLLRIVRKTDESQNFDILKPMDCFLRSGELSVVLGRPGSGCSTLLKTIAANTYGFEVSKDAIMSYDGISQKEIESRFRGNVIYSAESDSHFPTLTVGQTLEFAAALKTPQNRGNVEREVYAKHMAAVFMATYGLSHTRDTRVGNDFVRGVSGGERKRVSICEASLSGSNIQCWDNATRGLDSATALGFIRALKTSAHVMDSTPLVAIYQCSQDAYDLFDNVILMYEGYQIYFGKGYSAKEFFENMGYECPQRQTTADYLTSLTNPAERIIRKGYEDKVPKTAEEFYDYWRKSSAYKKLIEDIDDYLLSTMHSDKGQKYAVSQRSRQADHVSKASPYTVSFFMQVRYCMLRNFWRIKSNPSFSVQSVLSQLIMGLVLGSVFYDTSSHTSSFYSRSAALFFSLLFNAFLSLLEILSIFEAREIVQKHRVAGY